MLVKHFKGFAKFGSVGVLSTITDFVLFTIALFAGIAPLVANVISFVIANVQSYALNSRFTFRAARKGAPLSVFSYLKFFTVHLPGLGISSAVIYLLGPIIGDLPAKVVAIGGAALSNYFLSAYLVFGDGKSKSEPSDSI